MLETASGHVITWTLNYITWTSICHQESRTTFWRFLQVTSRAALVTALLAIWSPSFSTWPREIQHSIGEKYNKASGRNTTKHRGEIQNSIGEKYNMALGRNTT